MISNFANRIFSHSFFRQTANFTRITETLTPHGTPSKEKTIVTLVCIIQPAGKDDLEILPAGNRYNPTIRVWTQEPVYAGDELYHHSFRWKVINHADWSDYGYYDCLATRFEGSQTDDSSGFIVT